jgi:hypothetical protein
MPSERGGRYWPKSSRLHLLTRAIYKRLVYDPGPIERVWASYPSN